MPESTRVNPEMQKEWGGGGGVKNLSTFVEIMPYNNSKRI